MKAHSFLAGVFPVVKKPLKKTFQKMGIETGRVDHETNGLYNRSDRAAGFVLAKPVKCGKIHENTDFPTETTIAFLT
ncbi:MAG: hypothetical protein SWC96_08025 [Thermodesulfobacteriota bacterium]|nr:hypothetical protein [Thermodesulfobacteriota bacterium]